MVHCGCVWIIADLTISPSRTIYPLPRIDEILDNMSGCSVFSKLYLHQGYHQIRVLPENVQRTAFQMKHWSFQFRVLPFGMCNAPATFQRTMDALMRKHWAYVDVYLDDIIIHSNSMAEHIEHVRAISEDLRKEQLYAKLKKC